MANSRSAGNTSIRHKPSAKPGISTGTEVVKQKREKRKKRAKRKEGMLAIFMIKARSKLLKQRDEIMALLDGEVRNAQVLGDLFEQKTGDSADLADKNIIREGLSRDAVMLRKKLKLINESLTRVHTGNYGICIGVEEEEVIELYDAHFCGEEIDTKRLESNLTTKRCVPCQVKWETLQTRGRLKR